MGVGATSAQTWQPKNVIVRDAYKEQLVKQGAARAAAAAANAAAAAAAVATASTAVLAVATTVKPLAVAAIVKQLASDRCNSGRIAKGIDQQGGRAVGGGDDVSGGDRGGGGQVDVVMGDGEVDMSREFTGSHGSRGASPDL